MIRGGHRFPEFQPDGLSHRTRAAVERVANSTNSPTLAIDNHMVSRGSVLLVGPAALHRVRAAGGSVARTLIVPSRSSTLRFHQKPPVGELTHDFGARIWL